jgi:hypothetical protein
MAFRASERPSRQALSDAPLRGIGGDAMDTSAPSSTSRRVSDHARKAELVLNALICPAFRTWQKPDDALPSWKNQNKFSEGTMPAKLDRRHFIATGTAAAAMPLLLRKASAQGAWPGRRAAVGREPEVRHQNAGRIRRFRAQERQGEFRHL